MVREWRYNLYSIPISGYTLTLCQEGSAARQDAQEESLLHQEKGGADHGKIDK